MILGILYKLSQPWMFIMSTYRNRRTQHPHPSTTLYPCFCSSFTQLKNQPLIAIQAKYVSHHPKTFHTTFQLGDGARWRHIIGARALALGAHTWCHEPKLNYGGKPARTLAKGSSHLCTSREIFFLRYRQKTFSSFPFPSFILTSTPWLNHRWKPWLPSTTARSPSAVSVTPDCHQEPPTAERESAVTLTSWDQRRSWNNRTAPYYTFHSSVGFACACTYLLHVRVIPELVCLALYTKYNDLESYPVERWHGWTESQEKERQEEEDEEDVLGNKWKEQRMKKWQQKEITFWLMPTRHYTNV